MPKNLENHIIVCGIVKGIKNLILPLRCKSLGSLKRPIVILTNDTMGNDTVNGDTFIWPEINRFEEIYLFTGSALNPASLDKASAIKAKAIIILAKSMEQKGGSGQERLDADAIFMYKTIEAKYNNAYIVTELESISRWELARLREMLRLRRAPAAGHWEHMQRTAERVRIWMDPARFSGKSGGSPSFAP